MSNDLARYHRQMLLHGFGETGQRRLRESTAMIMGCGALGSAASDMLARAGIGQLIIIDRDFIELTNLQRQVLFDEQDLKDAIPKAEAAKRRIGVINSQVEVTAVVDDLNHDNIERYAANADILIDGLDNFETRYLANDCAVRHGIPYAYGGAVGTAGMAYAILPHTPNQDAWWETLADGSRATPCFRCIFEEAPPPGDSPTCDTVGVLGPVVSIIANFQAAEALKILTGNIESVSPTLLNIDLWSNAVTQLKVDRAWADGDCPCCKHGKFDYLEGKVGSSADSLCGRDAVQLRHRQGKRQLDLHKIAERLGRHCEIFENEFLVRAKLTDGGKAYELTLFIDGRAIVQGTGEEQIARGIYSKYVGN